MPSAGWRVRCLLVCADIGVTGCATSGQIGVHSAGPPGAGTTSSVPAPAASVPSTTRPTTSTSTTSTTTTTTTTTSAATAALALGAQGEAVVRLQQRLSALHFWLGAIDGNFGPTTEQAVFALQKSAGLSADGVVGHDTEAAIVRGVQPAFRAATGPAIEVDLHLGLLMILDAGQLVTVLNASSGGGYTYVQDGRTEVAETPTGVFHVFRAVDGLVVSPLGELWRPRFFVGGYAIHGSPSVPPVAVSHGCIRVSNPAMDWIWATGSMPIGAEVWVY